MTAIEDGMEEDLKQIDSEKKKTRQNIFKFHGRRIQLVGFVAVGLSSFLRHL